MSKERRIYVVGDDDSYTSWLSPGKIVDSIEDATIVLFTGGSDLSPSLYGKKSHPSTFCNPVRDKYELEVFKQAKEMGKKFLGICRGAQALCVFSGGLLCQDMSHPYIHRIKTNDGRVLKTNSLHHQSMYPFNLPDDKYDILAWAINKDDEGHLSTYKWGEPGESLMGVKDVEVCYFKDIGGLACQMHPEMMSGNEPWQQEFIQYYQELVRKYLDESLVD